MTNWNPDQLKAITSRDKNIIVSASAGAGKTTVLIERLVRRVLDDRIQIQEILAMTFTEAAASEMKKRLADQLHQKLEEAQNEADQQYIQTQLSQLQNAFISTIHSFCLSIVQKYYYILDLPAERVNHILDPNTVSLCQNRALEKALEIQRSTHNQEYLRLCQVFSARSESEDALKDTIKRIAAMASSQKDPNAFFAMIEASYQNFSTIQALPKPILDNFFDYYQTMIDLYIDALAELFERYHNVYPKEEKKQAIVLKKLDASYALKYPLKQQNYESFRTGIQGVCHLITPTSPDREDREYDTLRRHIQSLEDTILKHLHSEITLLNDIKGLYDDILKLNVITKDYRHYFALEKSEAQGIDFDDMEHFTLDILQAQQGRIAKVYQEQFKEIMVDEFQDSNDVQHALVSLICQPNNVFRVGDIKQSIYGFRHALPQLMRGLLENITSLDDAIFLRSNYRSKQMIVDFNNQLFNQLMNIDGFDSSYLESDYVTTGAPHQQLDNTPIVFHGLHYDELKEDFGYAIHTNVCKASYIASQIIQVKREEQRDWKDFVVLVRNNARKEDMKQALDALHIPCFVDVKTGFYQSDAVQLLLSCLTLGLHPHDDIAFASILLSDIGGLDSEALAQAALAKDDKMSYYQYFKLHPFPNFPVIMECIQNLQSQSLSQAILSVYELNNFYELQSLQDKTNLDMLYELAYQKEKETGIGVAGFLTYVNEISEMDAAQAIPIGSDENVVRVMSIHQSKGLQFPVVFLWSTAHQPTIEFNDLALVDNDLGIAIKHMELPQRYTRSTIHRIAMEHKKNRQELEEEMRILYVALTRAQQQMHIVDYVKDEQRYERPLNRARIYQRGGYTAWILHAFMHKNNPLFTYVSVSNCWEVIKNKTTLKKQVEISNYQLPYTTLHFQTASSTHERDLSTIAFHHKTQGATRGSILHELIAKQAIPSVSEKVNDYTITQEDVVQLLALQQNELYQKTHQFDHEYYEYPYTIKAHDTIYHGYMDYFAYNQTEAIIIDFKSDQNVTQADLIHRYSEQLKQYQKAAELLHPQLHVACYLYSLTLQQMIKVL